MRRSPPWGLPARSARGGITWVTALLLLLVVGGGYLAWTWVPVYVLQIEVKQVVRDYMNQAVRNPNDAELVQNMVHKLRTLDEQEGFDEYGAPAVVPTVLVEAGDVIWERDAASTQPMLHVAFQYTRAVPYPLIGRWTEKTLAIDLTGDLQRPDWGPVR